MNQKKLSVVLVILIVLSIGVAFADFATPFAEGPKVGDVRTASAWVITNASQGVPEDLVVLVVSDTRQWLALAAKAAQGVVPPELLGRRVMVTARVTERKYGGDSTVLEILRVVREQ